VSIIMKKTILLFALTLTSLSASAEVLEGIVIRVGDRIITRTQYERRLRDGYAEIEQAVRPEQAAATREEFRKGLVDDMINELLIKDRADRLNISVTDSDVKDAIERLKQQHGIGSDEQFEASLRNSGLTRAEMESRLRETLIQQKVFARELRNRSDMTDAELRDRYNREKDQYRLPERAHLREIVVLKPEGEARLAEARQRAAEIAEAARKPGTDFQQVASTMSESGTRDKGGDLGEVAKGDLVPELDKAVFSAPNGTVLGPLETKSAWHIILVEQRLPSEVPAFESVKDRLRRDATEETYQRDYKNYLDALRKDAFVQVNQEMIPKG
jgi:peptidyl-prolyl cis-trans isomerase SurA